VYQIERDLTRRIKVVPSEDNPESHLLVVRERLRVVPVDVVTPVSPRTDERSVGIRSFVRQVGVHLLDIGTKGQKAAIGVKIAALQPRREFVRKRFSLVDMNDS